MDKFLPVNSIIKKSIKVPLKWLTINRCNLSFQKHADLDLI